MNNPDYEEKVRNRWLDLNHKVSEITDRTVTIIGVTKTHPVSLLEICVRLGIRHIGENRVQELRDKLSERTPLRSQLDIHFIGPVQDNKVKYLPPLIDSLDSLSRPETVENFAKRWDNPKPLNVLLQINSTGEEQKSGILHQDTAAITQIIQKCVESKKITVQGFMTMGPTPDNDNDLEDPGYQNLTKQAFLRLKELQDKIQNSTGLSLPRLSMGMTHDYELAIQCGATEIRVGSLLFGAR